MRRRCYLVGMRKLKATDVFVMPDGSRRTALELGMVAAKGGGAFRRYRRPPRAKSLRGAEYMLADPCSYCGAPSTDYDHIESIHRNGRGSNNLDNLTRACSRCNNLKRTQPLLLWLARRAHRAIKGVAEAG